MAQRVYGIPYECGRSYNGETSRPLAMWFHENRNEESARWRVWKIWSSNPFCKYLPSISPYHQWGDQI
jgi:hypothetical protein